MLLGTSDYLITAIWFADDNKLEYYLTDFSIGCIFYLATDYYLKTGTICNYYAPPLTAA